MNEYAGVLDAGAELSETDFDVLLLYLSRDSGSIAYDGKVSCLCYILRDGEQDGALICQADDQIQAYTGYTN